MQFQKPFHPPLPTVKKHTLAKAQINWLFSREPIFIHVRTTLSSPVIITKAKSRYFFCQHTQRNAHSQRDKQNQKKEDILYPLVDHSHIHTEYTQCEHEQQNIRVLFKSAGCVACVCSSSLVCSFLRGSASSFVDVAAQMDSFSLLLHSSLVFLFHSSTFFIAFIARHSRHFYRTYLHKSVGRTTSSLLYRNAPTPFSSQPWNCLNFFIFFYIIYFFLNFSFCSTMYYLIILYFYPANPLLCHLNQVRCIP